MWVPPNSTFPGHHLTCALIMCALVRMKPNVIRNETKNRNSGRRPVSTIARSYTLEMLARVERSTASLGNQYDLAHVAALLDEAVRIRGAVEGEGLRDDGLQIPLLETGEQRLGDSIETALTVPPREHVQPEHALVLIHDADALPPGHGRHRHPRHRSERGREIPLSAPGLELGCPVHDQPPARAEQAVVLAKRRRPESVHDRNDAVAAGDPLYLLLEVEGPVVDGMVHALVANRVVLGRGCHAEYLGADTS